jgi:hypothetical protein
MEPEGIMRSFVVACLLAVIAAFGAALVLEKYQQPAEHAFASPSGARI